MKSKRINAQLASAGLLLASAALAADMPTGAPNQSAQLDLLLMPSDVATGREGQTYVVDSGNARIQVFSPEGESIDTWPLSTEPSMKR